MKTVEDYQKRDAHIVKYLKKQISKLENEYATYYSNKGKLSVYKDMLFKMQTIDKETPVVPDGVLEEQDMEEQIRNDGTYTWSLDRFEAFLTLKGWSEEVKIEHRRAFQGEITFELGNIIY